MVLTKATSTVLHENKAEEAATARLYIVDWETIHLNGRHFDIGQMAVELYLLWIRDGMTAGIWLMNGLVSAIDKLDEKLAYRVAMHMGSYLICMATFPPEWGDEEKIKGIVSHGRDMIVHAWNKDRVWFEQRELACLFRSCK
jgi:hypothetical protein